MAENGNFKSHSETYAGVMSMLKWGTIACALVGALVVTIIAT
jgi:hypothetical protein